jgi:diguanylate cyclase (GGDEF)-like protein
MAARTVWRSRLKVLIASSDPQVKQLLRHTIEGLGHDVQAVSDGEKAWALYQLDPPELVISDWGLLRVDGVDLCRRIKRHTEQTGIPSMVTLLTEAGVPAHIAVAITAGADHYMIKPLNVEMIGAELVMAGRATEMNAKLRDTARVIDTKAKEQHEAEEDGRIDALTKLRNRRSLDEDIEIAITRTARYGHPYALAICDIDHFKAYNDRFGHPGGDVALRVVSSTLKRFSRAGDEVYRYGGEEFAVLLPEQSEAGASIALERLRAAIEALEIPHPLNSAGPNITISAGIAVITSDNVTNALDWYARADAALYAAKRAGRNRVVISGAEPDMTASGSEGDGHIGPAGPIITSPNTAIA